MTSCYLLIISTPIYVKKSFCTSLLAKMTTSSLVVNVSFVVLGLGIIFHFIAFVSPYWYKTTHFATGKIRLETSYGLWLVCGHHSSTVGNIKQCGSLVTGDSVPGERFTTLSTFITRQKF